MSDVLPSTLPADFDEVARQAAVKGGIGFYVAQGLAKRGYTPNPNHACFSDTVTRKSLRKQLGDVLHASCFGEQRGQEMFRRPAYDFELNKKTDVFRVSSR